MDVSCNNLFIGYEVGNVINVEDAKNHCHWMHMGWLAIVVEEHKREESSHGLG